uniref:Ribonuclease H-like domain-containing protein n=1 Tax=Tanacetum cinerariifolium TaxID=118510 RepID=A0A6L2LAQ4_TANCI|nr:ribonuclease H-like domain-containing protein [Tanacetum cinerariifolium]
MPKTKRLLEYKKLHVVSYGINRAARPLLLFFSSEKDFCGLDIENMILHTYNLFLSFLFIGSGIWSKRPLIDNNTDLGLQLFRSTTSQLIANFDANWAGCPATRRSISGYCVFLGDNLLTWSSKRQDTLSRSNVEAEYRGVANVVAKTSWIHNLLRELHTPLFTATLIYCDNVSAVYMSANTYADIFTKALQYLLFADFRFSLSVCKSPAPTARAY